LKVDEMKARNKKGLTLIDVLISIGIFSLGVGGFSILFARIWRINSFVIEEGESVRIASMAINKVVSELRKTRQADNGAYMIKSADDFDLVVYMNDDDDSDTERVHYFLENEQLKKGVTKPTGMPPTYPSGDQSVSVMANYVTNTPADPIFYYYNENYPGDVINNPLSTPASIGDIKLMKIFLWINIKPEIAPDNVKFESFVNLRNLNEYNE